MRYYGAIEAGGTKFVCAIGDEELNVVNRISISTKEPEETMKEVIEFFNQYEIKSMGIGSFGPIDIDENSKTYGYITSTPKVAWRNFDLVGHIKRYIDVPIFFTTDVNTSLYGEMVKGIAKDEEVAVYFTIGTGIGGGGVMNGQFIQGFTHPEMGHMLIKQHPEDQFGGNCEYHSTCLEGLASGPAIEKRANKKGKEIDADDSLWNIIAYYLAQAAFNVSLIVSPTKIILGGGVMHQPHLIEKIRNEFTKLNNDYIVTPDISNYIVSPSLDDNQGIIGCFALAKEISN